MPTQMGANKGGYAYPRFPFAFPVTALTATATLNPGQCGLIAVTGGAAVTLTLPDPAAETGLWYLIVNQANYDLTVAAPTADTLITFNDTAADSVAFSTTNEKTGGMLFVYSNGTAWVANKLGGNTLTVNT